MSTILTESGVAADVARHVRDGIRSGRLAPGDRIVERAVAQEIGASSIAVRDAFARLSQEGWIERLPRRGVRVRRLTGPEVDEVTQLRVLLEGEAAARAALHPPLADLRQLASEMAVAAAVHDRQRLLLLDEAFHRTIWRAANAPTLEEILGNLRNRIAPLVHRALVSIPDDALGEMQVVHTELADALVEDRDGIPAAVAAHAERTRMRVRTTLEATPVPR